MKRTLFFFIIIAVLTAACGCGAPAELPEATADPSAYVLEDLVQVYRHVDLEYRDSFGAPGYTSYDVWNFKLDTPVTQEINREISDYFDHLLEDCARQAARREGFEVMRVESKAWIYGDVVTLRIANCYVWEAKSYQVYSVNLSIGERLELKDYAAYAGVSENELLELACDAMERRFMEFFGNAVRDTLFEKQLAASIDMDNIRSAKFYIDEDGSLKGAMLIHTLGGRGQYETIISIGA